MTFTIWSAITSDAVRVLPVFGAIVKFTFAVPVPAGPVVMTAQVASDWAVHAQAAAVVTVIVPVPPEADIVCSTAESSKRQGAAS
ncbi:MAG TPA: hypothetical protein VLN59_11785 [Burkholderiales bacterium]|nr:hypothetical protein [Burkholderiales bacterium]